MAALIVLRGNSGSGKTTVAKALQRRFGRGTLVISQDDVRRNMLWVHDEPGNAAIPLLTALVEYGHAHADVTRLEGILYADRYQEVFARARELIISTCPSRKRSKDTRRSPTETSSARKPCAAGGGKRIIRTSLRKRPSGGR